MSRYWRGDKAAHAGKSEHVMARIGDRRRVRTMIGLSVIGLVMIPLTTIPVYSISAELAKKCREMSIKAHPRNRVGSASGQAAAQRDFFRECVARNGVMSPASPPRDDSSTVTK